jgi:hypothetical protein
VSKQKLSCYAAMLCQDAAMWRFLQVADKSAAADAMRTMCGIQSRAELDSDPAKAEIFHRLVRIPFSEFNQQGQDHDA